MVCDGADVTVYYVVEVGLGCVVKGERVESVL